MPTTDTGTILVNILCQPTAIQLPDNKMELADNELRGTRHELSPSGMTAKVHYGPTNIRYFTRDHRTGNWTEY